MSPDISLNLCNFCLTNSAHELDLVRHRNPLFLRNEGHVEICWIKAVACGIDTLNSQFLMWLAGMQQNRFSSFIK